MKIKTTDEFNKVAAERMQAIGEFYQLGKRKSYDVSVSIVTVPRTIHRFKIIVKLPFDIPIYFESIDDFYCKSEAYRIYKGVHTPEDLDWLETKVLANIPVIERGIKATTYSDHLTCVFYWKKATNGLFRVLKYDENKSNWSLYYEIGNHILKCDLKNEAVQVFTYPHTTEPPLFSQSLYHDQKELFVKDCINARNVLGKKAKKEK
jgi:hypothetical protein